MPRVLVLTTEPVPLPGLPATGAGLRAWGLAQGLRTAGLDVTLLIPEDAAASYGVGAGEGSQPGATEPRTAERGVADFSWVGTFRRAALGEAVRRHQPDVIVLQHWGLGRELGEVDCPLAVDLAGPHLLERRLWGSADPEGDLYEKLDVLRRADFVTASGERQRLYFLPYLALAGWDIAGSGATPGAGHGPVMPVIPYSLQPFAAPLAPRADRLIYGGFFLPWQDPTVALEEAIGALDRAGRGELLFIGGPHPRLDVSRGRFQALTERLAAHPRVRLLEPMSYDRYAALLAEGGVALDLMARNAERELAFTTRTVVYLAAGLPVIHDNYSELGTIIERAGAGWSLDPGDRAGLARLLDAILASDREIQNDLASRAAAGRRLVEDELNWDKTIAPLAEFCRAPAFRAGKTAARLGFEERARRLAETEQTLETARRELATLRGKRWVRWGLALTSSQSWLRWPAAVAALVVGVVLIPIFWVNDRLVKKGE